MAVRKKTSMQQTVIHGFITFLLLTYASFVVLSSQTLGYVIVEDKHENHPPVYVPFVKGTVGSRLSELRLSEHSIIRTPK